MTSYLVVDNFYSDPDDMREIALNSKFDESGNYPGIRTQPHLWNFDHIKEYLEGIMDIKIDSKRWNDSEYQGCFQIVNNNTKHDTETGTWVHVDTATDWSCIVFLTPNPPSPLHTGTTLYRHKETGILRGYDSEIEKHRSHYSKWEAIDMIGNMYNRAVIFKGEYWHGATGYFGSDLNDGRLFQTFFFSEAPEPTPIDVIDLGDKRPVFTKTKGD